MEGRLLFLGGRGLFFFMTTGDPLFDGNGRRGAGGGEESAEFVLSFRMQSGHGGVFEHKALEF